MKYLVSLKFNIEIAGETYNEIYHELMRKLQKESYQYDFIFDNEYEEKIQKLEEQYEDDWETCNKKCQELWEAFLNTLTEEQYKEFIEEDLQRISFLGELLSEKEFNAKKEYDFEDYDDYKSFVISNKNIDFISVEELYKLYQFVAFNDDLDNVDTDDVFRIYREKAYNLKTLTSKQVINFQESHK